MEPSFPDLPNPPPGQDDLPCSDGEPMETHRHVNQMTLLIDSLFHAFPERSDMFVGGNMFVWYSDLQKKQGKDVVRGPDVFVALDAIEGRKRKSWVVWEEGKLPDVVIELTSDSTRHVDYGEKKQIYERIWRLPAYYVFDPETKVLEGWRLEERRFVPIAPDANGDLECRVLGLRLGVREASYMRDDTGWLRWIDPSSGRPLPASHERASEERARADELQSRADEERARADELQSRADALAAEVAELRRRRDAPR